MRKTKSKYSSVKRKNRFLPFFIVFFVVALFAVSAFFIARHFLSSDREEIPKAASLYSLWDANDFEGVYAASEKILEKKPLMNTALAFRGYSAFNLPIAQTDTAAAQAYLEEAINSLRVALQNARPAAKKQMWYILGKAYYQKDFYASYYYYADLAVEYLERAVESGYTAPDIPEYLGLSYASLGMTDKSIEAFTEALALNPSDIVLAAIGEQYYKAGDFARAEQYLFRAVNETKDDLLTLRCRNTLGTMYIDEGKFDEAAQEFATILEKDANFADAYYGLGVIYEKQGELVKARAEWRKALRAQANHEGALQKLNS